MSNTERLVTSSLSVATAGAFTLVPIGRAPRGVRWGLGAVFTLVPAAAAVAVVCGSLRDRPAARRAAAAAGTGAAVAAACAGAWGLSLRVDRAVEDALVRRRVRRPRVAMAVGAAAVAAAIEVLDVVLGRHTPST